MFMFGWWVYLAFPSGIIPDLDAGVFGEPWNEAMGPNLADNVSGVIWGAFVLFSATTASIMSGSVIERIRMGAFIILAVALGSFAWLVAAAWGWHPDGWLVTEFGYHDVGASGVVHIISGFFALGVLINLGPRIGKFGPNGEINDLRGHSVPMTIAGLMIIIIGFIGFMGACLIYNGTGQWQNIYGGPMTLSGPFTFNLLMSFAGGIIGAYAVTRDPFWMMSGRPGRHLRRRGGPGYLLSSDRIRPGLPGRRGHSLRPAPARALRDRRRCRRGVGARFLRHRRRAGVRPLPGRLSGVQRRYPPASPSGASLSAAWS